MSESGESSEPHGETTPAHCGAWTLEGYDTFEEASYPLPGRYPTEAQAIQAAHIQLRKLEQSQPSNVSGGQGEYGIQDRVYIIHPDGRKERFLG